MKKLYEKPQLQTEEFYVEDVIAASAPGPDSSDPPVDTVGGDFENPVNLPFGV